MLFGNLLRKAVPVHDEEIREQRKRRDISEAFSEAVRLQDFRIFKKENPECFTLEDLEIIQGRIRDGACSLDDLGVSEDEWEFLRHRDKVAEAIVYLNNARKGHSYYTLLTGLLEPKGKVSLEEIGTTQEEVDSFYEAYKVSEVKTFFERWSKSHKNLFFETDYVLKFSKEHGMSKEETLKAINETLSDSRLKVAFVSLLR